MLVRDHAGEHGHDADVQDRANDEGADDPDRNVPFRILRFLGLGRDGVESDIREKDNRRPGDHPHGFPAHLFTRDLGSEERDATPPVRGERFPVRGIDVKGPDENDEQHGPELNGHHDRIRRGAFFDPLHEDRRQQADDDDGREVNQCPRSDKIARRLVELQRGRIDQGREFNVKGAQDFLKIARPAVRDRGRPDGVFQNQVPADDPRHQFAERRVRVRVRTPGHGRHRGEFGVTEGGQKTHGPGHDIRQHECRARDVLRRLARRHENPRPDHGPDAQGDQLPWPQDPLQAGLVSVPAGHVQWLLQKQSAHGDSLSVSRVTSPEGDIVASLSASASGKSAKWTTRARPFDSDSPVPTRAADIFVNCANGASMDGVLDRRDVFHGMAALSGAVAVAHTTIASPRTARTGWVMGHLTGAQAIAEALVAERVGCVYGIPGAQQNELWDEFKSRGVPYLLASHEYSAACMADGYARSTGRPGVLCVVPGPGLTNALTGLGEALLDSSPIVALVGDVANGDKYRPFQVHSLDQVALLRPVCKCVYPVTNIQQIAATVRQAFRDAAAGEPGPVAVVVPYNLLIEVAEFHAGPGVEQPLPWDEAAFQSAVALLADRSQRVGIYAGLGCMNYGKTLTAVAEMLQAPVATSVSGKGCVPDSHPLAVGWGFGPHASKVAETAFAKDPRHPLKTGVTTLLAIGVKFSEVSTGYYGNPKPRHVIHVDINPGNLGQVMPADVCVNADAGLFLSKLLARKDNLARPADGLLCERIAQTKAVACDELKSVPIRKCGIDPLAVIAALRCHLPADAMLFTDVTASEHIAAEYITVERPRSYFNPVDNQAMGWALPAAVGAARMNADRTVAVLAGDGGFFMAMQELATAARDHLPVKLFVLDDHAFHYMQMLQLPAYKRTTATTLPRLDYKGLACGFGVAYVEAVTADQLNDVVRAALAHKGPVLVRIATDYGDRRIRWVEAVRERFTKGLTPSQKARFLARVGMRAITGAGRGSD